MKRRSEKCFSCHLIPPPTQPSRISLSLRQTRQGSRLLNSRIKPRHRHQQYHKGSIFSIYHCTGIELIVARRKTESLNSLSSVMVFFLIRHSIISFCFSLILSLPACLSFPPSLPFSFLPFFFFLSFLPSPSLPSFLSSSASFSLTSPVFLSFTQNMFIKSLLWDKHCLTGEPSMNVPKPVLLGFTLHKKINSKQTETESLEVTSGSLKSHGLQPARLLCPWNSPGKSPGVGCHFLLQGIFLIQGSNPGLLHCRQILYQLSYYGSPYKQ